jgi:hypothetical protein
MKLNEIQDESILNDIFNSELTIFEDIQGSKIYANWDGKNFTIKSKSLSSEPINMVDLAMQNYYNHAINYFNSLDNRVKGLINKKWWFGPQGATNNSNSVYGTLRLNTQMPRPCTAI